MNSEQPDLEAIFTKAIGITDEEERASYLEGACEGNPRLLTELKKMVEAHFAAASFLDQPAPELDATIDADSGLHQEGQAIGLYKLREELGSGGFGVVWAAEQTKPISRKVALKIIKPGMDTRDVIARFEAERQALALMDHPNIARVLDAGTTEQGRPYFVMELIRGVPITRYCDEAKLSVNERLALFAQVCKAIQHAHQKGIIHRDIKPSNVLVTLHDGAPVPKVIDFGIAKALNQRLTDKTIYTRVHQAIGTLAYMSPEQAELSGLDVDTRTDVYGLGVLLYELLTGTTPFDTKRLDQAALHEACRIIREEEPPKASNRISTLGETATIVSKHRGSSPDELAKLVRGDLDWVVLKALEKDRTRRYESAAGVAADVERYLSGQPVEAHPPSTVYRLRKFVCQNRAFIATASVVTLALLSATVVSWRSANVARLEKDRADQSAIEAKEKAATLQETLRQMQDLSMDAAFNAALAGDIGRVEEMTELARKAGESEDRIFVALAMADLFNGNLHDAIERLETLDEAQDSVVSTAVLSIAYSWDGQIHEAMLEFDRLASLPVKDDYDIAFRAFARNARWTVAPQNDRELATIVEKHKNWAMARWWYALSLSKQALDTGDLETAADAVQQAQHAARSLPKHTLAWSIPTMANHGAFLLARDVGDPRRDTFRDQCVAAINMLPDHLMQFGGWFYDDAGDSDAALKSWASWDAANYKEAAVRRASYIGCLLRAGDVGIATDVLKNDPDDDWASLNSCLVAAFLNRHEDIRAICGRLINKEAIQPHARPLVLALLSLCGDIDKAQDAADKWLSDERIRASEFEKYLWMFFGSRDISPRDLLQQAGESRFDQCRTHFYIAMRLLAEQNPDEAQIHLRKSSDLGMFNTVELAWARTLLHRLDSED